MPNSQLFEAHGELAVAMEAVEAPLLGKISFKVLITYEEKESNFTEGDPANITMTNNTCTNNTCVLLIP